jgi:superfamily II DNA/RNA helicase
MKRPRPKSLKRKQVEVAIDEEEEVKSLRSRYEQLAEDNTSGTQRTNTAEVSFADMPISSRTQKGLAAESMITATDIQIAAISHGLLGRDILGAG